MCQGAPEEGKDYQMSNLQERLSSEGRARQMAGLRKLVTAFADVPGIIKLHGGLPPASSFPITEMSFTLRDGRKVTVDDPVKLAAAQQYSMVASGYPPLHRWAVRHCLQLHAPPENHELVISNGNNQTIEVVMRLLLDKGDTVLVEEYTYPHIPESLVLPPGFVAIPLKMDSHGIIPSHLRQVLKELQAAGKPLPKLLYTVPTGQNPTGAVTPLERKRKIYSICREHDIILLEDDPYYYLQFSEGGGEPKGLTGLGSSYLSMDVDERVIRLDSFSKVLSPGLRIGWVTAAPAIIEKIIYHMQGIQIGANSFTQVVVSEMLEAWGDEGFERHVLAMQRDYAARAAVLQAAAAEHLQNGVLAEWRPPTAGMFLWLKLLVVPDADAILSALKDAGVILVPGRFSYCLGPRECRECPYIRVSFACAPHSELREGMARLGRVLRGVAANPAGALPLDAAAPSQPPESAVNNPSCFAASQASANGTLHTHDSKRLMWDDLRKNGMPEERDSADVAVSTSNGHAAPVSRVGDCSAGEADSATGGRGRASGRGSAEHLQERDSAFESAQPSANWRDTAQSERAPLLNKDGTPVTKMAQMVLGRSVEVMPDCQAKVQLAAGDAAMSEDALASRNAKTVFAAPAVLGA